MSNELAEWVALDQAISGAIPDDLPGYRQRYTERAINAILAAGFHMTATPDVLHISGPCEDGETVTVLCGVDVEAESPKSPDQPVCQACSVVQMAERNELNSAKESTPDVLAQVRVFAVAHEEHGANCKRLEPYYTLRGPLVCDCWKSRLLAILDREDRR